MLKKRHKDQFQVIFCSNSQENLVFLCFLVNLIHTYIESSKIQIFLAKFLIPMRIQHALFLW